MNDDLIVVTGGAGFIGSRLVLALNARGFRNIIVVDDLSDGHKCVNLARADIHDYQDKEAFLLSLQRHPKLWRRIKAIFHLGACSDTTEWDGKFVMQVNYDYTKALFHHCQEFRIPFIYASSAAVYGSHKTYRESIEYEAPINMYAYSKWQFDQYVRRHLKALTAQVVGLRYFNVYGPQEQHKGSMASVAYHFWKQMKVGNTIRLFEGCDGYENGEQRRDFVYVDDVVAVNLWFLDHPKAQGIFNVGTGKSRSFNDVARAVLAWHGRGEIEYVPFPEHLKGHYQSFTEADIGALRQAGCPHEFHSVEDGVAAYMEWLKVRLG